MKWLLRYFVLDIVEYVRFKISLIGERIVFRSRLYKKKYCVLENSDFENFVNVWNSYNLIFGLCFFILVFLEE